MKDFNNIELKKGDFVLWRYIYEGDYSFIHLGRVYNTESTRDNTLEIEDLSSENLSIIRKFSENLKLISEKEAFVFMLEM